jgi:Uri superfamily endonuclease
VEVWISQQKDRQEHLWATRLSDLNHTASPIARFGCSDCKCATHLYYFPQQPSFETFATLIEPALPGAAKMKKIILK